MHTLEGPYPQPLHPHAHTRGPLPTIPSPHAHTQGKAPQVDHFVVLGSSDLLAKENRGGFLSSLYVHICFDLT